MRRNKHGETAVLQDGVWYDSKAEADRALELKAMTQHGEIRGLQRQERYVLNPGFRDNQGRWERAITWKMDFVYEEH